MKTHPPVFVLPGVALSRTEGSFCVIPRQLLASALCLSSQQEPLH